MAPTKEKIQEAIETYGRDVVAEVRELVAISDPDGVWSTCQDMGMFEHAECIELLYFEDC
jgi:hypothetical protein